MKTLIILHVNGNHFKYAVKKRDTPVLRIDTPVCRSYQSLASLLWGAFFLVVHILGKIGIFRCSSPTFAMLRTAWRLTFKPVATPVRAASQYTKSYKKWYALYILPHVATHSHATRRGPPRTSNPLCVRRRKSLA